MAKWFVQRNGKTVGPLSSSQLRAKAAAGEICTDTPVRKAETGDWVAAHHVRGLFPETSQPHRTPSALDAPSPSRRLSDDEMLRLLEDENHPGRDLLHGDRTDGCDCPRDVATVVDDEQDRNTTITAPTPSEIGRAHV